MTIKVHIVTRANRARYSEELKAMHGLRHHVFVKELGWTALASADGLEYDEFDDEHAVYLIAMSEQTVWGSLRLLPAWRHTMIDSCWPDVVANSALPRGPGVWEWTRWCPGVRTNARRLIQARSALIIAALEFAESRDADGFIAFCDMKFLGQLEELGWNPVPHGLPRLYAEGTAIALSWRYTGDLLEKTRSVLNYHAPAALEAPVAVLSDDRSLTPDIMQALLRTPGARTRETPGAIIAGLQPASLADTAIQGRA